MDKARKRALDRNRIAATNDNDSIQAPAPWRSNESSLKQKRDKTNAAHPKNNSFGESSLLHDKGNENEFQKTSPNASKSQQTFSSRNSLRSAGTTGSTNQKDQKNKSTSNSSKTDMINHAQQDRLQKLRDELGLDDPDNYEPLNATSFVKIIGDFIYCILCGRRDRKSSSNDDVEQHLESIYHCERLHELQSRLLEQIPGDNSLHMRSISIFLDIWLQKYTPTNQQLEQRYDIIEEFNTLLQGINPECYCRISGSLLDGTSLISSNINLELMHPNSSLFDFDPRAKNSVHHKLVDPEAPYGSQFNRHTLHYDLIANASNTLYESALAISQGATSIKSFKVTSGIDELNSKVPRLNLVHEPSRIPIEICCYTGVSNNLSTLLNIYLSLDDRARDLCRLVKYWAKKCDITSPERGTYSSDTYIIMVIYFLQRTEPPVLPCLHDVMRQAKSDNLAGQDVDEQSLASQLDNYLNIADRKNSTSNTTNGHSDNSEVQANVSNNHQQVGEQLNDLATEEVEDEEDDGDPGNEIISRDVLDNLNWQSNNTDSLAKLFILFFEGISRDLNDRAYVMSIRTLRPVSIGTKKWGGQVKAIEHPIRPKQNISRCIGSCRTFNFIERCFTHTYFYLTSMPMDRRLKRRNEPLHDPTDYVELYVNLSRLDFYFSMKESSMKARNHTKTIIEMIQQNIFTRDVEVINKLLEYAVVNNRDIGHVAKTTAGMYDERYLISKDRSAVTFCWLCRDYGHKKSDCPNGRIERLQAESRNYDTNLNSLVNLDEAFYQLYARDIITPSISERHEYIRNTLADIINTSTGLNCKLQLFGSTVNLLGTCDSDLDVCMTIEGNLTGKGVDCVSILEKVHEVLIRRKEVKEMEPVLSARVPILKFKFNEYYVDLSMYNQCALHNSRLLRTYVMIDYRVAKLSYLVKRYAKGCGIADASRGSLSSYAWSLLVIHFLQHIRPPILPVLQETDDMSVRPIGVNGWNVWFKSDIDNLDMEENTSTLTELFKLFFLYYGTFDFSLNVISIRKFELISKFKKNWNNCMMAIEDPFELTYNLSSRLDDQMAIYIMNSFANTYRHILSIQRDCLNQRRRVETIRMDYLFDGRAIMKSRPPVRGCRTCHKIGHRHKDCPEIKRNKARQSKR